MRVVLPVLITLVGWATAQTSGQLRLVRNRFTSIVYTSGRLEVYYNGQWGTVCNDLWDSTNTRVACRQLGFLGFNTSWTTSSAGGFGSATGRIWLDNVNCFGTESRLTSCPRNSYGAHNCFHSEDVAINCSCSSTQFRCASGECIPTFARCGGVRTCSDGSDERNCLSCGTGAFQCSNLQCVRSSDRCDGTRDCTDGSDETGCVATSGDLRLVRNGLTSTSYTRGRLEVYYSGQWGTVCDDSWSSANTRVACRQLGFSSSSTSWTTSSAGGFGSTTRQIWLDNVRCTGTESRLASCSRNSYGSHNCVHSEDVAIDCSATTTGNAVGPAVGGSISSLVVFVIIPIIVCVVVGCCVSSRRRHTTVTTTTQPVAPTTTMVVTTSSQQQSAQQGAYPAAGTDVMIKKAPPPSYEMSTYPPQPAYPYPPQEVYPPPPQAAYPYPPQEVYPPPPQAAYPYPPQEVYPPPPQQY